MEQKTMRSSEPVAILSKENAFSPNTPVNYLHEDHTYACNATAITVSDSLENMSGSSSHLNFLANNEKEAQAGKRIRKLVLYTILSAPIIFLLVFYGWSYFDSASHIQTPFEHVTEIGRKKREISDKDNKNTQSFIFSNDFLKKRLRTPPKSTTPAPPTTSTLPPPLGFVASKGK